MTTTAPTPPTAPIREDHARLVVHIQHLRAAARELPELSHEERALLVQRVAGFLRGSLVPHADAEEHVLYPEVARILGHTQATAPMTFDHLAIKSRIAMLEEADVEDVPYLQELLYGLYALVSVHFWKEEEIYLPLLDAEGGTDLRQVLQAMEAVAPHGH